jgi:hypothetical protein
VTLLDDDHRVENGPLIADAFVHVYAGPGFEVVESLTVR